MKNESPPSPSVSSNLDPELRRKKEAELAQIKERMEQLERELDSASISTTKFQGYYLAYYATTGFMLGMFGAVASLLFNVAGSLLVAPNKDVVQHPLKLIQVYLTFPFGERALQMDSGLALALGCCLYIAFGMLLGVVFNVALTRFTATGSVATRLVFASVFAILVWIVNFYGILSWLQPLLFGGRWIVDMIPVWVAAATHLVFAWTMVFVYPWGLYAPYRSEMEQA
jgi:hypothetical protein